MLTKVTDMQALNLAYVIEHPDAAQTMYHECLARPHLAFLQALVVFHPCLTSNNRRITRHGVVGQVPKMYMSALALATTHIVRNCVVRKTTVLTHTAAKWAPGKRHKAGRRSGFPQGTWQVSSGVSWEKPHGRACSGRKTVCHPKWHGMTAKSYSVRNMRR